MFPIEASSTMQCVNQNQHEEVEKDEKLVLCILEIGAAICHLTNLVKRIAMENQITALIYQKIK
ncbi:hypothetical protein ACN4EE_02475 [Geminocystis sp. CENA526]|uniref:hypothetical protein n=1 Tax=Geminocystis sp. CENA526 TaxID=1355871 RepID=UPI003D6F69CF